jgi:hypothetical protein
MTITIADGDLPVAAGTITYCEINVETPRPEYFADGGVIFAPLPRPATLVFTMEPSRRITNDEARRTNYCIAWLAAFSQGKDPVLDAEILVKSFSMRKTAIVTHAMECAKSDGLVWEFRASMLERIT